MQQMDVDMICKILSEEGQEKENGAICHYSFQDMDLGEAVKEMNAIVSSLYRLGKKKICFTITA